MAPPSPVGRLSFPGCAFASAMRSRVLLIGRLGCTASRCGEYDIVLTAARSLCGSYVSLNTFGETDRLPISVTRNVYPSAGARATNSDPMLPLAPERLSTSTDCHHASVNLMPTSRARMSEVPPGGYGMMKRTGLEGYDAAGLPAVWAAAPAIQRKAAQKTLVQSARNRMVLYSSNCYVVVRAVSIVAKSHNGGRPSRCTPGAVGVITIPP